MERVCLRFYVTEFQKHDGKLLYEWLLERRESARRAGRHRAGARSPATAGTACCTKRVFSSWPATSRRDRVRAGRKTGRRTALAAESGKSCACSTSGCPSLPA